MNVVISREKSEIKTETPVEWDWQVTKRENHYLVQGFLALCDFWAWKKFALAKYLPNAFWGAIYFITAIFGLMRFLSYLLHYCNFLRRGLTVRVHKPLQDFRSSSLCNIIFGILTCFHLTISLEKKTWILKAIWPLNQIILSLTLLQIASFERWITQFHVMLLFCFHNEINFWQLYLNL